MKKTENKKLGKNKFYNIYKGKKESGFFFVLPTISISPKKILNWDISVYSIFLAIGKYFVQFNICEIVKDTNTEVFKENMVALLGILRSNSLKVNDMPACIEFLNKNQHIILIIKNSNVSHPYVRNIVSSYFNNQPFIDAV